MVDLSDIATAISMGVLREDAKVDTSTAPAKSMGEYTRREPILQTLSFQHK